MAANLTIDKIFADNLGTAFGGCVRDQSLNLFSPEIPYNAIICHRVCKKCLIFALAL